MATKKKATSKSTGMEAKTKTADVVDVDDLDEQLERGEAELPRPVEPALESLYTSENIEKFLMGEMTWAQLQGITVDEAYNIAEYGFALYQEGRYHDAQKIFEALVICNPYDSYFHNMLGATYQQLDLVDEAAEQYTYAIEMDDENLHAYVNRAELLLKNGEFERALGDLKKAAELDPDGRDEAGLRARALTVASANALDALRDILDETKKKSGKSS